MSDAPKINALRKKELSNEDFKIKPKASIVMPGLTESVDRQAESQELDVPNFKMDQVQANAFMEESVRILIHRGQDKSASKVTDYVAVNGIAAEILFKNGWVPIGYLPKGIAFTTKRKYVAVIAGARMETIDTNVIERDGEDPTNLIERSATSPLPFVVIEDNNPRGVEWLQGVSQTNVL